MDLTQCVKAVDLSRYQKVDYKAAADTGVKISILRIGQGMTFTDEMFPTHKAGAKAQGWEWGCYLFGDYRIAGRQQGIRLWTLQGDDHGRAHDWMDMEYLSFWGYLAGVNMYQWGCDFIEGYESVAGDHKLASYLNLDMLKQVRPYLKAGDPFLRHDLAIAWPGTTPPAVDPWPKWAYWQHALDVPEPWSQGAADLDYYNGSLSDFAPKTTVFMPVVSNGGNFSSDPHVASIEHFLADKFGYQPPA